MNKVIILFICQYILQGTHFILILFNVKRKARPLKFTSHGIHCKKNYPKLDKNC